MLNYGLAPRNSLKRFLSGLEYIVLLCIYIAQYSILLFIYFMKVISFDLQKITILEPYRSGPDYLHE